MNSFQVNPCVWTTSMSSRMGPIKSTTMRADSSRVRRLLATFRLWWFMLLGQTPQRLHVFVPLRWWMLGRCYRSLDIARFLEGVPPILDFHYGHVRS